MDNKNDNAIDVTVSKNAEAKVTQPKKKRGRKPQPKSETAATDSVSTPKREKSTEDTETIAKEAAKSDSEATINESKSEELASDIVTDDASADVVTDESAHMEPVDSPDETSFEKLNSDADLPIDEDIDSKTEDFISEAPKIFEEQSLDEMLFSALTKNEAEESVPDYDNPPLTDDESTAAMLRDLIEDQLETKDSEEPKDEGEEDEGWDDEFLDIPESFFEDDESTDDIQLSDEDEASSIAALLYDDDDDTVTESYDSGAAVSFSQLRMEMEKIRDDVRVLRGEPGETEKIEEPKEAEEDEADEEIEGQLTLDEEIEETVSTDAKEEPEEDTDNNEDQTKEEEITPAPKNDDKPKRVTPVMAESIQKPKEEPKEHIITINRDRIKEKATPKDRLIDGAFEIVEMFVFTLLVIMLVTTFLFKHSVVEGDSMERTLYNGDHLIISDLFYKPERGDIVVCEDHSIPVNGPIVKRVIALSGDTVRIENSLIYVNGEFVYEGDYVYDVDLTQTLEEFVVPDGEVFVMGDHRRLSFDSEEFGTINEDAILGKVILRFFPFDQIQFFD